MYELFEAYRFTDGKYLSGWRDCLDTSEFPLHVTVWGNSCIQRIYDFDSRFEVYSKKGLRTLVPQEYGNLQYIYLLGDF